MHFALPPRKSSHPPPYAPRQSRFPAPRLRRLQNLALFALALLTILYLLARFLPSSTTERLTTTPSFLSTPPPGTPLVVIVTPLDRISYDTAYIQKIKENRAKYAKAHGYTAFFPAVTDYDLAGAPSGWARIPAVRHAMTLHPHSTYFFHLDQHALIMNLSIKVEDYVMQPHRLESLMMRGQPIVPPESVIKTYTHLTADKVELVVTQDGEGLSQSSFILKQGEWARYFLDTWFDPLYRNYNFQKSETHALEHLVQWHSTILSRLAIIPQRVINSYYRDTPAPGANSLFSDGDFVINFSGCDSDETRECEKELQPFYELWKAGGREKYVKGSTGS